MAPDTQVGFLHVGLNVTYGASSGDAHTVLRAILLPRLHRLLAGAVPADSLPAHANGRDVTDTHLVRLAASHGLRPATLDRGLCRKAWAAGSADNPLLPSAMTDEFPFDTYLCLSAKDKAFVRSLADGLKVWFNDRVFRLGDSTPAKIKEGREHSHFVLLRMSVHAFGLDWTHLEAGTFRFRAPLHRVRRFIPRRRDGACLSRPRSSSDSETPTTQ